MRAKVILDAKGLGQQLGELKRILSEDEYRQIVDALVGSMAHPDDGASGLREFALTADTPVCTAPMDRDE